MYSLENFHTYTLPKLVAWFNSQPAANRIMPMPLNIFKVALYEKEGVSSAVIDGLPPEGSLYIGESVFLYLGAPSLAAITVNTASFTQLSKTLMPQGEAVIDAINRYTVSGDL